MWAREKGVCQGCGGQIVERKFSIFDHRPALWARQRDETRPKSDPASYTPHANDPAYMVLLHNPQTTLFKCHDLRTFGDGIYRGDVTEAARLKRRKEHEKAEAEFRRRVLAPVDEFRNGVSDMPLHSKRGPKRKKIWPSRKVPSRINLRRREEKATDGR